MKCPMNSNRMAWKPDSSSICIGNSDEPNLFLYDLKGDSFQQLPKGKLNKIKGFSWDY